MVTDVHDLFRRSKLKVIPCVVSPYVQSAMCVLNWDKINPAVCDYELVPILVSMFVFML